jgi:hypothetical protein
MTLSGRVQQAVLAALLDNPLGLTAADMRELSRAWDDHGQCHAVYSCLTRLAGAGLVAVAGEGKPLGPRGRRPRVWRLTAEGRARAMKSWLRAMMGACRRSRNGGHADGPVA